VSAPKPGRSTLPGCRRLRTGPDRLRLPLACADRAVHRQAEGTGFTTVATAVSHYPGPALQS